MKWLPNRFPSLPLSQWSHPWWHLALRPHSVSEILGVGGGLGKVGRWLQSQSHTSPSPLTRTSSLCPVQQPPPGGAETGKFISMPLTSFTLEKCICGRKSRNKTKMTRLILENKISRKAIKDGDEWEIYSPTNWPFSPDDCKSVYSHKAAQQVRARPAKPWHREQPGPSPSAPKAAEFRCFTGSCHWIQGHCGLSWAFPKRRKFWILPKKQDFIGG